MTKGVRSDGLPKRNARFWRERFPGMEEECFKCFTENMTATQTAVFLNQKFSASITRNAVVGKWHRAGLFVGPEERGRRLSESQRINGGRRKSARKRKDMARFAASPLPAEWLPANPKTLLELTNSCCRWPFGDPSDSKFFFCGRAEADITENRPYCREHFKLSANPKLVAPLRSLPD